MDFISNLLSREGWIAFIMLVVMTFVTYYFIIFPELLESYTQEFWMETSMPENIPDPKAVSFTDHPCECCMTKSLSLQGRIPKYLNDSTEREVEILFTNELDKTIEVDLNVQYSIKEKGKARDQASSVRVTLSDRWHQDWMGDEVFSISPDTTKSFRFYVRPENKLYSGSSNILRDGDVLLLLPKIRSRIVPDDPKSKCLWNPMGVLPWHLEISNDMFYKMCENYNIIHSDSEDSDNNIKDKNPSDNALTSCFNRFQSMRHSAIEKLLMPPWSNGVLVILVFSVVWFFDNIYEEQKNNYPRSKI